MRDNSANKLKEYKMKYTETEKELLNDYKRKIKSIRESIIYNAENENVHVKKAKFLLSKINLTDDFEKQLIYAKGIDDANYYIQQYRNYNVKEELNLEHIENEVSKLGEEENNEEYNQ